MLNDEIQSNANAASSGMRPEAIAMVIRALIADLFRLAIFFCTI